MPLGILGIESSCDETSAAVVEDRHRILSNVIASQVDCHAQCGSVLPERGFGVRIEDFLWLNPVTKTFETIGEFRKDLVIPIHTSERQQ